MTLNKLLLSTAMLLVVLACSVLATDDPQIYLPPQYRMNLKNIVKGTKVFSTLVAADHVVGKFSHKLTSPQGFESQYIYDQLSNTLFTLNQDSTGDWSCTKQTNAGINNLAMDPLRASLLSDMLFSGKTNCQNQDTKKDGVCYKYDKTIVASMIIDYSLFTNATSILNLPMQLYKTVSSQNPELMAIYSDYKIGPVPPSEFDLPVPQSKCVAGGN
jgi:hypothetical protein